MTGEDRPANARLDAGDDSVPQLRLPRRLGRATLPRDPQRYAEADDPRDVLGPGAPAFLLTAARLHRRDTRPTADVQRADALRPVELVRIDRKEVDGDLAHVELERADRLHGVAVERHTLVPADRADLRDRLDRSDLVVGMHHRDKRGALVDRIAYRVRLDEPVAIDPDHVEAHAEAALEIPRGVDHGVMLDRRRYQAIAFVAARDHRAAQREVV